MFDLEESIASWRRQMLAAGIETPGLLNELESHLREDIERQIKFGARASEAFRSAAKRIGSAEVVKMEFAKVRTSWIEALMLSVCVVLVGFIFLFGGFTFWFMGFSIGEQALAYSALIVTLAVACGWRSSVSYLPVIRARRKRILVELACAASGFLLANLAVNFILPYFVTRPLDRQIPAVGFFLPAVIAIGIVLACGIEEAARQETARCTGS